MKLLILLFGLITASLGISEDFEELEMDQDLVVFTFFALFLIYGIKKLIDIYRLESSSEGPPLGEDNVPNYLGNMPVAAAQLNLKMYEAMERVIRSWSDDFIHRLPDLSHYPVHKANVVYDRRAKNFLHDAVHSDRTLNEAEKVALEDRLLRYYNLVPIEGGRL